MTEPTDLPTPAGIDDAELAIQDADELILAEAVLLRMSEGLPDPTSGLEPAQLYATLIAIRARSLYENFLHALTSPAEIAPMLAIRPLVEAAILSKWISLNPLLHGTLWFAQSEDREITAIREQEKHLGIRMRGDIPPDTIIETIEDKASFRDAAIKAGQEAGKKYGDKAMPSLVRLVEEIEKEDPTHRVAMRQAYDLAYRAFSPWMHTEAASFKATAIPGETATTWIGDVSPYHVEHLRLIAGAMFAYALEILGIAKRDGSEVASRFMRDYLTIYRQLDNTTTGKSAISEPAQTDE